MLNTININLKTDIKTDRPTSLPITLMSQDKNNNHFILRFTNGGESVGLDDTYTVEVLTKFAKSGASRLTTAKVRQDYATWKFDTAYITQDETVYNYVYVRKSGSLVVSADANCFVFNVGLSEVDKGAGKVAETYDENYQKYLDEFKGNVDFEEIAQAETERIQAEQARKEAETLREESYEQKVDTALIEADVVEKVDNKVTELTPRMNDFTEQLAQTDREKISRGNVSVSDINKNLGKFDQTYMTDDFIRQFVDNTQPINAIPENLSITSVKLADKTVTAEKTDFIETSTNLIDNSKVLRGKSVRTSDGSGSVIDSVGNSLSGFIPVKPSTAYSQNLVNGVFFYDENRLYLSNESPSETFVVPENCYYIRARCSLNNDIAMHLNIGGTLLPFSPYFQKLNESISDNLIMKEGNLEDSSVTPQKTSFLTLSNNLFDKDSVVLDKSIDSSGEVVSNNGYALSDYIATKGGTSYTVKGMATCSFFDNNKNFLSRLGNTQGDEAFTFETSESTRYIRVSVNLARESISLDTTQINEGTSLLEYDTFGYRMKNLLSEDGKQEDDKVDFIERDAFVIDGVLDKYYVQEDVINNPFLYLDDVYQKYDNLVAEFPDYVTKTQIGTSFTGLPIYRYDFKPPEVIGRETKTPKMFIVSGTHGAERIAVGTLIHVMNNITRKWKTNEILETLKWNVHFIVVPISNPDGWTSYGGGYDGNARYNMNGVDINRNFPSEWSSELVAPGTAPFSEPESLALKTVFDAEKDIIYFCDFHNFSGITNPDLYYQYIWIIGSNQFNVNLSKTLIRKASREWKKRYDWLPQDNTMFGYSGWRTPGTIASYAASIGINASTFEVSQRIAYASVAGLEDPSDSETWSISNGLAVETFTNWLLLNLRNNTRF